MVFIRQLIILLIKISLLLLVVSFEKVVGLPIIFITLLLIFFTNERSFHKYIYLVLGSLFLATVYGFSISFSLLLLTLLVLAISYGNHIISSDINRVLLLIYSAIMVVAIASQVVWVGRVVSYFVISSSVMIFILMKTLFFKHGLTGRITGKKSNFFR